MKLEDLPLGKIITGNVDTGKQTSDGKYQILYNEDLDLEINCLRNTDFQNERGAKCIFDFLTNSKAIFNVVNYCTESFLVTSPFSGNRDHGMMMPDVFFYEWMGDKYNLFLGRSKTFHKGVVSRPDAPQIRDFDHSIGVHCKGVIHEASICQVLIYRLWVPEGKGLNAQEIRAEGKLKHIYKDKRLLEENLDILDKMQDDPPEAWWNNCPGWREHIYDTIVGSGFPGKKFSESRISPNF